MLAGRVHRGPLAGLTSYDEVASAIGLTHKPLGVSVGKYCRGRAAGPARKAIEKCLGLLQLQCQNLLLQQPHDTAPSAAAVVVPGEPGGAAAVALRASGPVNVAADADDPAPVVNVAADEAVAAAVMASGGPDDAAAVAFHLNGPVNVAAGADDPDRAVPAASAAVASLPVPPATPTASDPAAAAAAAAVVAAQHHHHEHQLQEQQHQQQQDRYRLSFSRSIPQAAQKPDPAYASPSNPSTPPDSLACSFLPQSNDPSVSSLDQCAGSPAFYTGRPGSNTPPFSVSPLFCSSYSSSSSSCSSPGQQQQSQQEQHPGPPAYPSPSSSPVHSSLLAPLTCSSLPHSNHPFPDAPPFYSGRPRSNTPSFSLTLQSSSSPADSHTVSTSFSVSPLASSSSSSSSSCSSPAQQQPPQQQQPQPRFCQENCRGFDVAWNTAEDALSHCTLEHPKRPDRYQCALCGYSCGTGLTLKRHLLIQHQVQLLECLPRFQ
jgi:hypothetical protein